MKEIVMKEPIQMKLEQFECPACRKKIYINIEDIDDKEILDCPFCDVCGIVNIRLFEIEVQKIFEKEE